MPLVYKHVPHYFIIVFFLSFPHYRPVCAIDPQTDLAGRGQFGSKGPDWRR